MPPSWPPADLPVGDLRDAADLLLVHHVPGRAGTTDDPATVAAVVGAEQITVQVAGRPQVGERVAVFLTGVRDADRLSPSGIDELGAGEEALAATVCWALEHVVTSIARRDRRRPPDAELVNAEAGRHPVASEEALLRAAIRAGHRSLEAMPYYALRYGERGRRFTGSDSAWLVSFVDHPVDSVLEHVDWLARLLAVRGMPTWLLESHLRTLADEVGYATDQARTRTLRQLAEHLADLRRSVLADDVLHDADRWLVDELGSAAVHVPRAGALVAAATADAAADLTDDDDPCVGWLADPDRFDPTWAAAVQRVRSRCRRHAI